MSYKRFYQRLQIAATKKPRFLGKAEQLMSEITINNRSPVLLNQEKLASEPAVVADPSGDGAMENRLQPKGSNKTRLIDRLDRATRDVNAFLLVVAIGLATLDFTAYCAFKITEEMPTNGFAATATTTTISGQPAAAAPAQAAVSQDGIRQPATTRPHESTDKPSRSFALP